MISFPIVEEIAREPYEPRGILNSEMALIIGLARAYEIDLFIESGRARGQSTYLLGKYLPDVDLISIERTHNEDALYAELRVASLKSKNIGLTYGDGNKMVPTIVKHPGRRIAVLLDGPKGHAALDLMAQCAPYIKLGFIHDMRQLDHGEPSPFRRASEERFPSAFYSDAPDLVARLSWMDAPVWAAGDITGWRPYHVRKTGSQAPYEFTGSYGPTVGVYPFDAR